MNRVLLRCKAPFCVTLMTTLAVSTVLFLQYLGRVPKPAGDLATRTGYSLTGKLRHCCESRTGIHQLYMSVFIFFVVCTTSESFYSFTIASVASSNEYDVSMTTDFELADMNCV